MTSRSRYARHLYGHLLLMPLLVDIHQASQGKHPPNLVRCIEVSAWKGWWHLCRARGLQRLRYLAWRLCVWRERGRALASGRLAFKGVVSSSALSLAWRGAAGGEAGRSKIILPMKKALR